MSGHIKQSIWVRVFILQFKPACLVYKTKTLWFHVSWCLRKCFGPAWLGLIGLSKSLRFWVLHHCRSLAMISIACTKQLERVHSTDWKSSLIKVRENFSWLHIFAKSVLNSTKICCLCFKIPSGTLYVHVHGNSDSLLVLHWNACTGLRISFNYSEKPVREKMYCTNLSL